jgi:BON domain
MNHFSKLYQKSGRFRESDSFNGDEKDFETNGTFTHSNFRFDDEYFGRDKRETRPNGRFPGRNRYGEETIRHDSYQDDHFYEVERIPSVPWSNDSRSEASRESHFGKGPKGYKRSPERIRDEACEILARDFDLDASDIEVDIKDDVLILKGEVNSRRDKRLAEYLVENIAGISDVLNQLKIKKTEADGWISGAGNVENEI